MEQLHIVLIKIINWLHSSRLHESHIFDPLLTNLLIIKILQTPSRENYERVLELNKQKEWRETNRVIKGHIDKCLKIGTNKSKQTKRLFDIFMSLILLLTSPLNIWLVENKINSFYFKTISIFLKNKLLILIGNV